MSSIVLEYALPEWDFHDRSVGIVAYVIDTARREPRERRYVWRVETKDVSGYNVLVYGQWPAACQRLPLPASEVSSGNAIRRWYRLIPESQWKPVWWAVSTISDTSSTQPRQVLLVDIIEGTDKPDGATIAMATNIWDPRHLDILWIEKLRMPQQSLITVHLIELFHRHLQGTPIPARGRLMPGLSQEQATAWFAGMYAVPHFAITSVSWNEWQQSESEISFDVLRSRLLLDLPIIQQRDPAVFMNAASSPPNHHAAP